MNTTEQKLDERITALENNLKEMLEILRPISETYRTVSILGKWGMGVTVFISIVIGIVLGFLKLFNK